MPKKKIEEGFDHIRCLAYASLLSVSVRKEKITADELFLSGFLYTKENRFHDLFWKFLGLSSPEILQEFLDQHYDLTKTALEGATSSILKVDAPIQMSLDTLVDQQQAMVSG